MDEREEFGPATGESAEVRLRRTSRRRGARTLGREQILPIAFVAIAVLLLLWWLVGLRGRNNRSTASAFPPATPTPAVTIVPTTVPPTFTPPPKETPSILASPPPLLPAETVALPSQITVGGYVKVTGTGVDKLSFRFGPGLNNARIRLLSDGTVLKVVGGPEQADGYRWWRLEDLSDGTIGWAIENNLVPTTPP